MGRQDEEDFQKRHAEYQDDYDGNGAEDLSKGTCDEQKRGEGRNGRQNANGHRTENALNTAQGSSWVKAVFFLLRDDVLSNDHRIVDDDTQHDNQSK